MASSELIKHVDKERRDTFNNQFEGNKLLFKTFKAALTDKYENSIKESDSIDILSYPNYTQALAHKAGYRLALKEVLNLLPED